MSEHDKAQRMGFTISAKTKRAIEMLAREEGVSTAWMTKMLLGRGLYLEGLTAEGGTVVVRMPDGSEQVLLDGGRDYIRRRLDLRDD